MGPRAKVRSQKEAQEIGLETLRGAGKATSLSRAATWTCPTWVLTLEAGQIGILWFGFQQMWQPCIAVPKTTALGVKQQGSEGQGDPSFQVALAFPAGQAYPPKPHQDPVGLGPGPLLIGCQEVPHHGNTPVKVRDSRNGVRLGMML